MACCLGTVDQPLPTRPHSQAVWKRVPLALNTDRRSERIGPSCARVQTNISIAQVPAAARGPRHDSTAPLVSARSSCFARSRLGCRPSNTVSPLCVHHPTPRVAQLFALQNGGGVAQLDELQAVRLQHSPPQPRCMFFAVTTRSVLAACAAQLLGFRRYRCAKRLQQTERSAFSPRCCGVGAGLGRAHLLVQREVEPVEVDAAAARRGVCRGQRRHSVRLDPAARGCCATLAWKCLPCLRSQRLAFESQQ